MTKRIDKDKQMELLTEYFALLAPLAHDASQAFGSRATASPEHTISRQFTNLLAEYHGKGGSLLLMSDALGITYPALRRRVMTSSLAPLPRGKRSKATAVDYQNAAVKLLNARKVCSGAYHAAIKEVYDSGISLNKMATFLGMKSAYPLYYGLNKARLVEASE